MDELGRMDDVIGQLGKYQVYLYIAASVMEIPVGMNSIFTVFGAAKPPYQCRTCLDGPTERFNYSANPQLEDALFCADDSNKCIPDQTDSCLISASVVNQHPTNCTVPDDYDFDTFQTCTEKSAQCDSWIFDNSIFNATVITEFNLVCGDSWQNDLATSIYYLGFGVGGVVGGILSDRWGRKPLIVSGSVLLFLSGIANSFSPNIWVFTLIRFIIGCAVNFTKVVAFTYMMEVLGSRWRANLGVISISLFALGELLLAYPFAYTIRNWRNLQFWLSFTAIPSILTSIFLPTSYRWLVSKKRVPEAKAVARSIAERNKSRKLTAKEIDAVDCGVDKIADDAAKLDSKGKAGLADLFKKPRMKIYTWVQELCWFTDSMVFYGLGLNAGNLPGGDPFFNSAMSSTFEFLSYFVTPVFISSNWWGRRRTNAIFMILGGLSCGISTLALELQSCDDYDALEIIGQVFAYVGRFFIGCTFAIAYIYSCEIYPSEVRSTGLAINSFGARVAGFLSPWVLSMVSIKTWLPGLIFTVLGVASGCFAFMLPETRGQPLLTTLDEAEDYYQRLHDGEVVNDDNSSAGYSNTNVEDES